MQTALLSLLALIAFAANSLLNREALAAGHIDPLLFALLRLISGAFFLLVLCYLRQRRWPWLAGSWRSGLWLALYAGCFSLAYLSIPAGAGAFVLFVCVQFTMTLISLLKGERLNRWQWLGYGLALAGFIWFVSPGSAQGLSLLGLVLMAVAGIAWGLYTLRGRHSVAATNDTAMNFVYGLIWLLPAALLWLWLSGEASVQLTGYGIVLALVSGALASGAGYALWYSVLPAMKGVQAGLIQLTVPIIAAAGSVLLLDEHLSSMALLAAALVLVGIAVNMLSARR